MRTEDLFKYGVTPKEGPCKGQKFNVENVTKDGVSVIHENGKDTAFFPHGEYDLWREPKTLFEDDRIPATWGNLKKAAEKAGISDDTEFAIQEDGFWLSRGICRPASFSIEKLREVYGKTKTYILVK